MPHLEGEHFVLSLCKDLLLMGLYALGLVLGDLHPETLEDIIWDELLRLRRCQELISKFLTPASLANCRNLLLFPLLCAAWDFKPVNAKWSPALSISLSFF